MPYKKITIEFKHSPSPRFAFALKEARTCKTFSEDAKTYSATYEASEFEAMHRLVERLKSFIHKRVFIDGEEYSWNEVFAYLWCYGLKEKAYDKDQYCHGDANQFPAINPWGCIQVNMPMSRESEWFRYGKFDVDGKTFIFNKKMIEHYFTANTERFRFCPALDIEKMKHALARLPESVNPAIHKDWEYVGPVFKSLMVSVGLNESKPEHPCGVCLNSMSAVKNLYKRMTEK